MGHDRGWQPSKPVSGSDSDVVILGHASLGIFDTGTAVTYDETTSVYNGQIDGYVSNTFELGSLRFGTRSGYEINDAAKN